MDKFWLQLNQGADTVQFFDGATDILQVSGAEFGIFEAGQMNVFNRPSDHLPTGAVKQFIYQQNTNELWFDADGSGGTAGVLIATFSITLPASLSTADFGIL